MLEKRIAYGNMVVRAFSPSDGEKIAAAICKQVIGTIDEMWPGAFYVTELAGTVSGIERPIMQPLTGARGVFKKK